MTARARPAERPIAVVHSGDAFEVRRRALPLALAIRDHGWEPVVLIDDLGAASVFALHGIACAPVAEPDGQDPGGPDEMDATPDLLCPLQLRRAALAGAPLPDREWRRIESETRKVWRLLDRIGPKAVFAWNGHTGAWANALRVYKHEKQLAGGFMERGPVGSAVFVDPEGVNGQATIAELAGPSPAARFTDCGSAAPAAGDATPEKIIFVPLQVHDDSNVLLHSERMTRMRDLVSFAIRLRERLGQDWRVLVRTHPEEEAGVRLNLPRRPFVEVDGASDLDAQISRSAVCLTINSNVGLTAALAGRVTVCFGEGIYCRRDFVVAAQDCDFDRVLREARARLGGGPATAAAAAAFMDELRATSLFWIGQDATLAAEKLERCGLSRVGPGASPGAAIEGVVRPGPRYAAMLSRLEALKSGAAEPVADFDFKPGDRLFLDYRRNRAPLGRAHLAERAAALLGRPVRLSPAHRALGARGTILLVHSRATAENPAGYDLVLDEFGLPHARAYLDGDDAPPVAPSNARLEMPSPGAMIRGDDLVLRGSFDASGEIGEVVARIGGVERARAAPTVADGRASYEIAVDISGLPCRMDIEVAAGPSREALHRLTAWRPGFSPVLSRLAPLAVELRRTGDAWTVETRAGGAPLRLLVRAEGKTDDLGVGRKFVVPIRTRPVHLWAAFEDGARPDAYLGRLPAEAETAVSGAVEELRDFPSGARLRRAFLNGRRVEAALEEPAGAAPRALVRRSDAAGDTLELVFADDGRRFHSRRNTFRPLRAFLEASAAGAQLALAFADGRRATVDPLRFVATGPDWTLVAADETWLRDIPLGDLVGARRASPAAGPAPSGLAEHLRGLAKPAAVMASDVVPPASIVLPAFGERAPPQAIDRVVLVRPGAFPTDELYVLAPLAPLLDARRVALEVVSLDDAEASAAPEIDERTVVIVSRTANDAWLDRLCADPRAYVVYLMDDDPAAAADDRAIPHRDRRRLIELAQGDFQALLRRCDLFVVTSPWLARRYASSKTRLLEPPFIRPAPSLAHLDDLSTVRIVYHGTDMHRQDVEFLFPALAAMLKRTPHARLELISGQPVPNALSRLPNVEVVKPMGWADYKAFAAANPAHVSLAPMLETPFNAPKSVVKVLDAASLGAVGVYSAVEPFTSFVTDGVDGLLLENEPDRWEKVLHTLSTSPKKLRRIALACQHSARTRSALSHAQAFWSEALGFGEGPR